MFVDRATSETPPTEELKPDLQGALFLIRTDLSVDFGGLF